jgi:hypothetical protein
MDKLRTSEIRRIELQIKDIEVNRRRAEDTLKRIRAMTVGDSNFISRTVEKNKEVSERSFGDIEDLKNRIISIQRGDLDDSLREVVKNTTNKFIKDHTEKEKEKKTKAQQNSVLKTQSWSRDKEGYQEDRKLRDADKQYMYMLKVVNSLPDYLKSNLSNMPGNKGYIYRGVWFMGYLPEEYGQPTLMFERKGHLNLIHEYKKDVYLLWERDGRSKKLLSKTQRRQRQ